MGKWSESQYDRVLVGKLMTLFEHAMERIDQEEGPCTISDKRFRTFVKKLDADDLSTRSTFRNLVSVVHGKSPVGRLATRPTSQPSSDRIYPLPSQPIPIYHGESWFENANSHESPRHHDSQSRAEAPPPMFSWDRYFRDLDESRNGPASQPVADQRPATLLSRSSSPLPLFFPQFPSPLAQSPSSMRVNRVDMTRTLSNGDDVVTERTSNNEEPLTISASSNAWLDEYRLGHPEPSVRAIDLRRPTLQRLRLSRPPLPLTNYDSDQTEVPDEFDNLLNTASSSASRIARRRRRAAEDEAEERVTRRARIDAPSTDIRLGWEGHGDSWTNTYRTDPRASRWSDAVSHPMEYRDTRRDGVVFDTYSLPGPVHDPAITPPGDEQSSGHTFDSLAARHRETAPRSVTEPSTVEPVSRNGRTFGIVEPLSFYLNNNDRPSSPPNASSDASDRT
ncbi:hypothetical protein IAR55_006475 [Kwoniella newhampshirensis]|uniref:Uncharacterized protein n=1 Tax=Kwoniella newhampshirensis TaxID=1651941 RepID=A0AAW0YER5_9TREE